MNQQNNQHNMKKILITTILLIMGLYLSAQNLYVQNIDDGAQTEFGLTNNLKVTFANRIMSVVTTQTTSPQTFPLTNVQNLSFVPNTTTSIALTTNDNRIRLFSNPVKDELIIVNSGQCFVENVEIVDLSGRIVISLKSLEASINVSNLHAGIYFVKIKTNRGVVTEKFIKK